MDSMLTKPKHLLWTLRFRPSRAGRERVSYWREHRRCGCQEGISENWISVQLNSRMMGLLEVFLNSWFKTGSDIDSWIYQKGLNYIHVSQVGKIEWLFRNQMEKNSLGKVELCNWYHWLPSTCHHHLIISSYFTSLWKTLSIKGHTLPRAVPPACT